MNGKLDKSKVAKWYKLGLWSAEMVADAVGKGKLSAAEYEEITGEMYPGGQGG